MTSAQIGMPVGKATLIDPEQGPALGNTGASGIKAAVFAATQDITTMRATIKTLGFATNNLYTDKYLDTLTSNDMLKIIMDNQDTIANMNVPATAWAATTDYDLGIRVTNSSKTLRAIIAGTSDALAPTNPGTGLTVVDGTVTWYQID